jgi:hypothetical protein
MNGLHVLAQAAANNDIVKRELNELVKESPSIIGPTYLCFSSLISLTSTSASALSITSSLIDAG